MTKNISTPSSADFNAYLNQIDDFCELYLVKKAPALPENVKEVLVKIAPYLAIIGVVFTVPSLFALFGLNAFLNTYGYMAQIYYGPSYYLNLALVVVSVVIMALAIPGLFKRQASAWRLMFYSSLVNVVANLISFHLVSLIIGTLISFYFLYQVKSYYRS